MLRRNIGAASSASTACVVVDKGRPILYVSLAALSGERYVPHVMLDVVQEAN
jgi:hypothetical protein